MAPASCRCPRRAHCPPSPPGPHQRRAHDTETHACRLPAPSPGSCAAGVSVSAWGGGTQIRAWHFFFFIYFRVKLKKWERESRSRHLRKSSDGVCSARCRVVSDGETDPRLGGPWGRLCAQIPSPVGCHAGSGERCLPSLRRALETSSSSRSNWTDLGSARRLARPSEDVQEACVVPSSGDWASGSSVRPRTPRPARPSVLGGSHLEKEVPEVTSPAGARCPPLRCPQDKHGPRPCLLTVEIVCESVSPFRVAVSSREQLAGRSPASQVGLWPDGPSARPGEWGSGLRYPAWSDRPVPACSPAPSPLGGRGSEPSAGPQ